MAFTKSTTDIAVHKKLSDYPNQDDGLTAEELKARFDYPAETLQKDVNVLIDELGDISSASNVGANELSLTDRSEANVQAKLKYLYDNIAESSERSIADGSVTANKLADSLVSQLAFKDGSLQNNLNAGLFNGKNENALYDSFIKIGSYTGNTSLEQSINVGFKPSAVIVCETSTGYKASSNANKIDFALITKEGFNFSVSDYYGYSYNNVLTDNGFKVGKPHRSNMDTYESAGLNRNGKKYVYVAFR